MNKDMKVVGRPACRLAGGEVSSPRAGMCTVCGSEASVTRTRVRGE